MKARSSSLLKSILLLSAGAATLGALPALAQEQMAAEMVTVTGTRIPRPETDLPSPTTTVSAEDIQNSGTTNLTDYLKRIPALSGSLGDFESSGYATQLSTDGTSLGGLNLLNLRNLGFVRTLVLIDGKRTVSQSTGSAAVDINSIPLTMIDRVDTATGGASAIYGADGVSGVVNFVMKHDLEGVHARFQGGAAQQAGGERSLLSVAAGHNFDDGRGNITVAFEGAYQQHLYFNKRDFERVGGRAFFVANPNDGGGILNPNPGVDDPRVPDRIATRNVQYTSSAPSGAIDVDGDGLPDYVGAGGAFNPGIDIGNASAIGSSGMPYAEDLAGDFAPTERRYIVEMNGHYDFSDAFKLSADIKWANVQTKSIGIAPFDDVIAITDQNPYLPANVANAITANGGVGYLAEDFLAIRNFEENKRNTYRAAFEASGELAPPRWLTSLAYNISYVYGQTDTDDIQGQNRISDRFYAALDSVTDPATGQPTCRSNLDPTAVPLTYDGVNFGDISANNGFDSTQYPLSFTPGAGSGCSPFNPFGPNAASAASKAFVTGNLHTLGVITQNVISGYLSASLPAFEADGPLSLVLGGEYRKETSKATPEYLLTTTDTWSTPQNPVAGSFNVGEVFGEASLPIFKDRPYARELSVDGAVRYSAYSTAGGSTSWKFGAVWAPFDSIKFRGTEAFAVRAPNIGELFAPVQSGSFFVDDPCDKNFVNNGTQYRAANCQAIFNKLGVAYTPGVTNLQTGSTTLGLTGGNPNLKPESARTLTGGVVIQPLDGLVLTADWYNVNITQAIEALDPQTIAEQCVDLPSVDTPFCAATLRNPGGPTPGSLTSVSAQQINVASFVTAGLDLTATYHAETRDWFDEDYGGLTFRVIGNYLDKLTFRSLEGVPAVEADNTTASSPQGTQAPRYQANLDTVWTYDSWTVDYNIDWAIGMLRTSRITLAAQPDIYDPRFIHLADRFVHSLQVGKQFDDISLYAGINNLFYQKPTYGTSGTPVDPLGRFFYLGVTLDTDKLGL
jgi:outer membrane receptor protein involved in Fe transport